MPCDCLLCQSYGEVPEPAYYASIRLYMRTRTPKYTEQAVKEVLEWIKEFGSVEACESIDDVDRASVERLIPSASPADWSHYDSQRWVPSDYGYPDHCPCPACAAEAAEIEANGAALV